MTGNQMKRKIAAALCMAIISGCMPFATLAEENVSPAQAVEPAAPQYTKIHASAEVDGSTIIVYASGMSNPVICVTLDGEFTQNMNGSRHIFTDVAAGEHTVQVRYNAGDAAKFASDVITVVVNAAPQAEPVIEYIEPAAPPEMESISVPADAAPAVEAVPQTEPAALMTLDVAPIIGGRMPEIHTETVILENIVQAEPPKAQLVQLESVIEKAPAELIAPVAPDASVEVIAPVVPDASVEVIAPVVPDASVEVIAPVVPDASVETVTPVVPDASVETVMPVVPDASVEVIAPVVPDASVETVTPGVPDASVEAVTPVVPAAPVVSEEDNQEPVFSTISAQITTGADSITVTIIESSSEAMYVAVGEDWKDGLYRGDSATFSGLVPGEYDIEVDYMDGSNVFRTSAVIKDAQSDSATPPAGDEPGNTGSSGEDDVTVITPPDSGDGNASLITPPASGESGSTGSSGSAPDAPQTVKAFTILPVVTDGTISVVIDGASDREVEVMLLDQNGSRLALSSSIGSGLVKLGKFSSGAYTVRAQYVTPVQAEDGSYDFKTVTANAVVEPGITVDPAQTQPVDIKAKAEAGKDYVIVTVTESAEAEMYAALGSFEPKILSKGDSVRFDGLTPGASYDLEIDYVNPIQGASPYRTTVTLAAEPTLGAIKITGVTAGTNMLTVSGTATAGQQIIITTTPAAAGDVYAAADASGAFSAQIACAAGTYTGVTAKYVADSSISATASGSWVVTAPAQKPTLTVDAVDTTSTTVVAKTTPGVIVEIKTGDYTQRVIADDSGLVRFSLPHTYPAGTKFTLTVYYGADNKSAFEQTVTVSDVPYLGTLSYGDTGSDVKTLTRRLRDLGYLADSTSRYGSTVREAVLLFQRANGLDDDGIAGPKTQYVLFSVSAIPYGSDHYPTLVRGDRGYALIYTLQQRLKDLGYYTIKVDGIFGSGTQRAVREFQRVNGLSVTGKADNATQTLLYSSAAKPADQSVSGDYTTLSRSGKYKSKVVPLQRRLKALGYYSGNVDGYFGSQTYRAVRNFQSRNGLTVTGVADPYTQQVLYSSSAKAASGSSSSSSGSTTGYRLLYWGCRGDAVRKLQNALIDAGYKKLVRTADGIFGQWTYDAVRAYQKDKGLAVDGIAGKNTQNALYGTSY